MFCQERSYSEMHPLVKSLKERKKAGNAPEFLSILNEVVYLKENYGRHYFSLN